MMLKTTNNVALLGTRHHDVSGPHVNHQSQPGMLSTTCCRPGALVMLVGEVGCGKSSLLAALLHELAPRHGTVTLRGAALDLSFCQSMKPERDGTNVSTLLHDDCSVINPVPSCSACVEAVRLQMTNITSMATPILLASKEQGKQLQAVLVHGVCILQMMLFQRLIWPAGNGAPHQTCHAAAAREHIALELPSRRSGAESL